MKKVRAGGGTLTFTVRMVPVSFDLGPAASKWAAKILHPPSRLVKIGAKPDWRVATLRIEDQHFLVELEDASAFLSIGRTLKKCDAIFFGATAAAARTARLCLNAR